MNDNQNGNVFVYILIAVALLGGLMFALSKSASQGDPTAEVSEGRNKVAANEIIAYATSTENSILQMQQTGVTVAQIDFLLPSDSNFNTAPTAYKLFHPDGGGLNYKALPAGADDSDAVGLAPAYHVGRFSNVEWTPTTAHDVIFTAYEIKQQVCAAINYQLMKSSTIPTVSGDSLDNLLVDDSLHTGTNADFMITNCAACENIPAMCVTNGTGKYAFYSLLEVE